MGRSDHSKSRSGDAAKAFSIGNAAICLKMTFNSGKMIFV